MKRSTNGKLVIVTFNLDPDDWHGRPSEGLWGRAGRWRNGGKRVPVAELALLCDRRQPSRRRTGRASPRQARIYRYRRARWALDLYSPGAAGLSRFRGVLAAAGDTGLHPMKARASVSV